jgi:hypothetical protein
VSAPPIPSAPADLELIAQLKSKLQYAELRIRVLEERLRLLRIEKYGAGGEKLLVERIGCTSAAHRPDPRLQPFSQSWKAAAG